MRHLIDIVENQQRYRLGMCDAMALALHRHYGYPLAVWRGFFPDEFGDEGDEAYEDAHMCVVLPDRSWADVDGLHSAQPENLIFNQPVTRVEMVPVSEEDARQIFTTDGVTDEQIEEASSHMPDLS